MFQTSKGWMSEAYWSSMARIVLFPNAEKTIANTIAWRLARRNASKILVLAVA
jgi:hypothetical protein